MEPTDRQSRSSAAELVLQVVWVSLVALSVALSTGALLACALFTGLLL